MNGETPTFYQTFAASLGRLEDCLQHAHSIVPVSSIEKLIELLPAGTVESQRFILTELVKLDMTSAAEMGQLRLLDFYLKQSEPWLNAKSLPFDLVLEELQIRRDSGQEPTLDEYLNRFPQWSKALSEFPWKASELPQAHRRILPELEPNQKIEDFLIVRQLGRGAFSHVYLAQQESLLRFVALKMSLHGSNEPQTLSQLDHPNIVRVYDQRTLESHQVHLLYMQAVLGGTIANVVSDTQARPIESLRGSDLLASIDRSLAVAQQQPPERDLHSMHASLNWAATVALLGHQLADGLDEAHRRNILHLDVKPANILLTAEGHPKLADFNVSQSTAETQNTSVGGTIAYMSPEQLRLIDILAKKSPQALDGRTDLFSLAAVLWELWQGQRPWKTPAATESWLKAVQMQHNARHESISCDKIDRSAEGEWLEKVLRHALQTDPDMRPKNGKELGARLKLALHPQLVRRFCPAPGSLNKLLLRSPVLITAAIIIYFANGLAGVLNYQYNHAAIMSQNYGNFLSVFTNISIAINCIAFSFGGLILVYFCLRVSQALKRASSNTAPSASDIDWIWKFGFRSAMVGAMLWISFGGLFPVILRWYEPEFRWYDFSHFVAGIVICGGIAWIYPFYGLTVISMAVYYPHAISSTMNDPNFEKRTTWLQSWNSFFLASSIGIPLLALALLILKEDAPRPVLLFLVVLTLLAVVFSYHAHQWLTFTMKQFELVLAKSARHS